MRKSSAPSLNLGGCPKFKCLQKIQQPYCLGSAESPAADSLLVWLKSSRSDPRRCVDSQTCRPRVPCPCPVMAFIQTSDQSGAGIAAAMGFPGARSHLSFYQIGRGRVAIARVQGVWSWASPPYQDSSCHPSQAIKFLILLENKSRHVGMYALTRFAKQEPARE